MSHTVKLYVNNDPKKYDEVAWAAGSGASGGIVGAFRAVFGNIVEVVNGLDFIAEVSNLDERIKQADLVITGEGSYDD